VVVPEGDRRDGRGARARLLVQLLGQVFALLLSDLSRRQQARSSSGAACGEGQARRAACSLREALAGYTTEQEVTHTSLCHTSCASDALAAGACCCSCCCNWGSSNMPQHTPQLLPARAARTAPCAESAGRAHTCASAGSGVSTLAQQSPSA